MPDSPGILNPTTIAEYEKGAQDLTMRSRLFLAMLQHKNRVTYNHSGETCKWQVEYSEPQSEGYTGGGLEFGHDEPWMQLEESWRGLVQTQAIDLMTFMKNRGSQVQLVNVWQGLANLCMKGLKNDFCGELFNDGSDSTKPVGLRSFLTETTPVVGDKIAAPNDTYGGKSTVPGAHGGTWSANMGTSPNTALANDWPYGQGRPEYDCLCPKLVNTVSTAWTGQNTWLANAWRVLNTMKTWMSVTGDKDHKPDLCLMAPDYWDGFKENQECKTHIYLPHKNASDLGFDGVLNFEGLALHGTDFDTPASSLYMLNLNTIEIRCMFDVLFKVITGKTGNNTVDSFLTSKGFDIDSLSDRIVILFLGNPVYMPKFVGYGYPYAAS